MGDLLYHISNAVSTLTVLSCLFLKVPQIINVKKSKSAKGLYPQAMLMEIIGFSIMALYNFTNGYSLMTYLEYPIILIQVYVLFFYVLKYKNLLSESIVPMGTSLYFITVVGFILGFLPKEVLGYLVPFCTPLSGFAKVSYMYGIIKASNADAVSLTTWIISVLTNVARIFTIYVDSADKKLMLNFIISSLLSMGVLVTAIFYQNLKKSQNSSDSSKHEHRD